MSGAKKSPGRHCGATILLSVAMFSNYRWTMRPLVQKKQGAILFFAFLMAPLFSVPQVLFSPILLLADSSVELMPKIVSVIAIGWLWIVWVRSQRRIVACPRDFASLSVGASRSMLVLGDFYRNVIVCWPVMPYILGLFVMCRGSRAFGAAASLFLIISMATLTDILLDRLSRKLCLGDKWLSGPGSILLRLAASDVFAWTRRGNTIYHSTSAMLMIAAMNMAVHPAQQDRHMYFFVIGSVAAIFPLIVLATRADEHHKRLTSFLGYCHGDRVLRVYRAALAGSAFVLVNLAVAGWFAVYGSIGIATALKMPCCASLGAVLFVCGRLVSIPGRVEFSLALLPLAQLFIVGAEPL